MAAAKRFASNSADEIAEKRIKMHSMNTLKANRRAANALREYLRETKQNTKFEDMESTALAEVLGHFYMDARKPDGERYKCGSL
jgi:hypothetical protein